MIDRRFLLATLAGGAVEAWLGSVRAATLPTPSPAELLFDELSRLQARIYSEASTPMLLACEDLAGDAHGAPAGFEPTSLNERMAATYREFAALVPKLARPVNEYDAATLVEILAARDFEAGGR